jgi:hypothetical protein
MSVTVFPADYLDDMVAQATASPTCLCDSADLNFRGNIGATR